MATAMAVDSRLQLRRLIHDGLKGRSLEQLFQQLVKRMQERGERLSLDCFEMWVAGTSFPANRHRQKILAEVVGGPCGDAILALPGPAFRGWRLKVMREGETMFKPHSGKDYRHFEMVTRHDEAGKPTQQARITCSGCGATYHHLRRGPVESEQYFRNKGWQVGKSPAYYLCPECLAARKKVVKMEDHVKKNGSTELGAAMSKEDGRLLSRMVEDHWDEARGRYLPGWSDARMAEHCGKPAAWVKAIRERDFGGTGEDPGVVEFVQQQVEVSSELDALKLSFDQLTASTSTLAGEQQRVMALFEKYRDRHNTLAEKVRRLQEAAGKLGPFGSGMKAAG